jgi:hypothetical protein
MKKLDLLKKWVNSKCDVTECTVNIIISEARKKSDRTKMAWLSEAGIVAHYFGDADRAKEACTTYV